MSSQCPRAQPLALLIESAPRAIELLGDCLRRLGFELQVWAADLAQVGDASAGSGGHVPGSPGPSDVVPDGAPDLVIVGQGSLTAAVVEWLSVRDPKPPVALLQSRDSQLRVGLLGDADGLPDGVVGLPLEVSGERGWDVELEHLIVRLMGPFGARRADPEETQEPVVAFGRAGSAAAGSAPKLLVLDLPGWRERAGWAGEFEQLGIELKDIDPERYDPRIEGDARGLLLRDEFERNDLLSAPGSTAELSELCARLSVLVISSRGDAQRAQRFIELGAVDYLVEPFGPEDVALALARVGRGTAEAPDSEHAAAQVPPQGAAAQGMPAEGAPGAQRPVSESAAFGLPWLRLDREGRVRGWNAAGAELFEGPAGAAAGQDLNFAGLLATSDAAKACRVVLLEVLEHGLPQCVEWPQLAADGSVRWVAWDVVPTGADEVCLFGMAARLREALFSGVESAREEIEDQLAGSGQCLLAVDAERGLPLLEAGPMGAIWGRSLVPPGPGPTAAPLLLSCPEDDRPEFAAALARARRGYAAEVLHGVSAGASEQEPRQPRLSRLLPMHGLSSGPDSPGLAVLVLTGIHSSLERARRLPVAGAPGSGLRLSRVLSSGSIVLFSVDAGGRLRLTDPQLLSALDLTPEESPVDSIFGPFGDVPALVDGLRRALAGESTTATVELSGRLLEISCSGVRDANGRVESATAVAIDVTSRSHAEEQLKLVVEATSSVVGQGFFRSLVRYLTRALGVRLAYIAELPEPDYPRLRMLCLWSGTEYSENYDYDPEGTPDGIVLSQGIVHYPEGLQHRFGAQSWVGEQGVQSYLGVPIQGSSGQEIGVLGVMDTEPLGDAGRAESILRIFAARAGVEIERLRAEQLVAESEARWRSLVQNAPDLICTLDRSGRVLFSNKPLGLGPEGPTRVHEMVPEPYRRPLRDALEGVLADGEPRSLEHQVERPDGRMIWLSSRIGPLEREGGGGAAILIATDITSRKEAQAKLEFRGAVEQLVTAISARFINLDREEVDDGIRSALAQLGELAGVDRAHVFRFDEGGEVLQRTHAWVRESCPGFLAELRCDSGALRWVLPAVGEGRELFVKSLAGMGREQRDQRMELAALGVRSLIAVPMTCAGERLGFLGFDSLRSEVDWDPEMLALLRIVGDVIAQTLLRKRSEEVRVELETQLRQAQKLEAIGGLAGGVAHDFNNLLTGILGHASLLRSRAVDPEIVVNAAEVIEKAAQRGAGLTRQLLGFAREGPRELALVDLHEVVGDVCELFGRTLNRNISLCRELNAPQPQILGDRDQIQAVLLNLTVNARDALPEGGQVDYCSSELRIRAEEAHMYPELQPGRFIEVRVVDNGTGIRPELLDRLFDPFFTTKAPGKGTGMGLAMVYGIVRDHGGVVRVSSELEQGTEFRLLFPLDTTASPRAVSEPRIEPLSGSGRVLVVDDEPIVRATAAEMLRELGYEVLLAVDGRDGLRQFAEDTEGIDLVLLDLIMPEMDGRACFRELRKLDPELPIVLSSGWGYKNLAAEFPDQGGLSGLVRKPYQLGEFSSVVAHAIRARALPAMELEPSERAVPRAAEAPAVGADAPQARAPGDAAPGDGALEAGAPGEAPGSASISIGEVPLEGSRSTPGSDELLD